MSWLEGLRCAENRILMSIFSEEQLTSGPIEESAGSSTQVKHKPRPVQRCTCFMRVADGQPSEVDLLSRKNQRSKREKEHRSLVTGPTVWKRVSLVLH